MDSHLGDFEIPLGSRVSTSAQYSVTTKRGEALTEVEERVIIRWRRSTRDVYMQTDGIHYGPL
jgi:hypothetical protein